MGRYPLGDCAFIITLTELVLGYQGQPIAVLHDNALSHAILPGVAVGYLLAGMSLVAMGVGGFIAGVVVALVSGLVSARTNLKDDASFAGFYLGSLALGVTLISLCASSVDLLHLLFGSILANDGEATVFVGIIASVGLAWSFYAALPAGPAIVLTASCVFFLSILFGPRSGLARSFFRG